MAIFVPAISIGSGKLLTAVLLVIIAQQVWIYVAHRRSRNREELFRIITENAADMIALVNVKGRRLYNSPSYSKVLGVFACRIG
jgi:PAS domain-containing protein